MWTMDPKLSLTRQTTRRIVGPALAVGALALVAAACGGSTGSSGSSAGSTAAAPPANTTTESAGQSSGTQIKANLTEFHIALSEQPTTAGTYTFVVTNGGSATHALTITGPGVTGQHTGSLSPGQSANLTVTLQNGSYDVFCPVDGHKGMGMDMTVTVGGGTGSATNAPAPTTTAGGGGYGGGY